jgi:hypothetical protein
MPEPGDAIEELSFEAALKRLRRSSAVSKAASVARRIDLPLLGLLKACFQGR